MSKTEQELANELDAYLSAKLTGQESLVSEELPKAETKLAADLVELAAATNPDPLFLAELEANMARSAERAASGRPLSEKTKRPERQAFWQEFISMIRSFSMKRSILTLGVVAALFIFAIFAWTTFNDAGQSGDEPLVAVLATPAIEDTTDIVDTAVADNIETGDTEVTSSEPTELTLLPRMEASQGGGTAMGLGGGGGEAAPIPMPADAAIASTMIVAPDFSQVFADATFVLNTTLPVEPTVAIVHQRIYHQIALADVRLIADQFGFTGPIYVEVFDHRPGLLSAVESLPDEAPSGEGVSTDRPAKEPFPFEPPTIYRVFNGKRSLTIFPEGVSYIHNGIDVDYQASVANAMQIAETFLQERGLLDFPYIVKQGYSGGEVQVHRLIEGVPLDDPELFVQVANSGEVVYAGYHQMFTTLQNLGSYPLMTAESAWKLILEDVVANKVSFNIMPDFDRMPQPLMEPHPDMPQHWQHQYQPDTEIHVYAGPVVYQRADGDGPPRIEVNDVDQFILNGDAEDLQAIADQIGNMFHFWGQFEADNTTLTLAGWDVMPEPMPLSLDGEINRTADQVLFLSNEGETFILPDAPADLPDGLKVNLFAWASRDVGLAYPVLDWQHISEWFDYDSGPLLVPLPEPIEIEGGFIDPFDFKEITIDEVTLAYLSIFNFDGLDKTSQPPVFVQPVWQFSGQTDNGDIIQLRVQAVAPEYLQVP